MTQLSVHKFYKRAKTRKIHSVFFCPFINENVSFCECFKGRATVMILKISFISTLNVPYFCVCTKVSKVKNIQRKNERGIFINLEEGTLSSSSSSSVIGITLLRAIKSFTINFIHIKVTSIIIVFSQNARSKSFHFFLQSFRNN